MTSQQFPLQYVCPQLPVIDLDRFRRGAMTELECSDLTQAFADQGVVCIRDSRVVDADQRAFRSVMVDIHGATEEELLAMDGADTGYQFGMTPPGTEFALDHSTWVDGLLPQHRPLTKHGKADSKSRWMWAIGNRPHRSAWPQVNAGAKIPRRFAKYAQPLTRWGLRMLEAGRDLLAVVERGLDLSRGEITDKLDNGPHILGPTGSDFSNVELGQVLAGLHYDFNVVTMHGQTDIRALICWTRDGVPFLVEVPDGCLLAQAGKLLCHLTAGFFFEGLHEVVVTPESLEDARRRIAQGIRPIRVSSNLFVHLATRHVMRPLGRFATPENFLRYPPIYVGDYESAELAQIGLFTREYSALRDRVPPAYRAMMARLRSL